MNNIFKKLFRTHSPTSPETWLIMIQWFAFSIYNFCINLFIRAYLYLCRRFQYVPKSFRARRTDKNSKPPSIRDPKLAQEWQETQVFLATRTSKKNKERSSLNKKTSSMSFSCDEPKPLSKRTFSNASTAVGSSISSSSSLYSMGNASGTGSHPQMVSMDPEQLHLVLQQDVRSSSRSSSIDSSPVSECPSSVEENQFVKEEKMEKLERPMDIQPVVVQEMIVTPTLEETVVEKELVLELEPAVEHPVEVLRDTKEEESTVPCFLEEFVDRPLSDPEIAEVPKKESVTSDEFSQEEQSGLESPSAEYSTDSYPQGEQVELESLAVECPIPESSTDFEAVEETPTTLMPCSCGLSSDSQEMTGSHTVSNDNGMVWEFNPTFSAPPGLDRITPAPLGLDPPSISGYPQNKHSVDETDSLVDAYKFSLEDFFSTEAENIAFKPEPMPMMDVAQLSPKFNDPIKVDVPAMHVMPPTPVPVPEEDDDDSAPKQPSWSVGAEKHFEGTCSPCGFYYKKECHNGASCPYCHMCSKAELRRRKREKVVQVRKEEAMKILKQVKKPKIQKEVPQQQQPQQQWSNNTSIQKSESASVPSQASLLNTDMEPFHPKHVDVRFWPRGVTPLPTYTQQTPTIHSQIYLDEVLFGKENNNNNNNNNNNWNPCATPRSNRG